MPRPPPSVPPTPSPGRSTASGGTPRPGRSRRRRNGSGTRDPLIAYHAGVIAAALGREDDARDLLTTALALDPGFSATGAADARRRLANLPS